MTEREAFIEAIAADPLEDTPRLAFADWLQENGEEDRAEFVRLSHELLARFSSADDIVRPSKDIQKLLNRVQALFESHAPGWLAPFCRALGADGPVPIRRERWSARMWRRLTGKPRRTRDPFSHLRFGYIRVDGWGKGALKSLDLWRGFVNQLEIDLEPLSPIPDAAAAFAMEPVSHLSLKIAGNSDQWRRLNAPCLARIESLTLDVSSEHSPRVVEQIEDVLHGGHWSGVDTFHLWRSTTDFQPAPREYVERLASAPLLSGLHSLSLVIERPNLHPLVSSPRLQNLRSFSPWGCRLPTDGADALAAASFRPNLEELNLALNEFGADGACRLAAVEWPKLRSLDLGCNDLTDTGVRHLLPLVPQLTNVFLTSAGITDAGALALAGALDPEKLESLWLSYNPLTPQAVAALRARFGDRFHFETEADRVARS